MVLEHGLREEDWRGVEAGHCLHVPPSGEEVCLGLPRDLRAKSMRFQAGPGSNNALLSSSRSRPGSSRAVLMNMKLKMDKNDVSVFTRAVQQY